MTTDGTPLARLRQLRRSAFLALRNRWPRATMALTDLLFVRLLPFEPELPVLDALLKHLPRNGLAVDVGANSGLYAAFLAKRFTRVLAFEPNPAEAALMRRWLPATVDIREEALSDQAGPGTLWLPLTKDRHPVSPLASLARERVADLPQTAAVTAVPVTVTTLDQVLADRDDPPLAFLKIDVEGHELEVINGAIGTLRRHLPIILAEHSQSRPQGAALVERLGSLGYVACRVRNGALQALNREDGLPEVRPDRAVNLVFLHLAAHRHLLDAL